MREEKKKVKSIVGGGAGPKFLLFTPSFDLHWERLSDKITLINIQFQTNYRQALQFILSDKNIFLKLSSFQFTITATSVATF